MKKLIVFTKENNEIVIEDDDKSELSEYCKKVAGILSGSNVTILETSSESIIIRPSCINFFRVSETKGEEEKVIDSQPDEDIITDGE